MKFTRHWAMPNSDTFDVPPIAEFVKHYLRNSSISVDHFARNKRWATYTNDLNPETEAEYHMDALEFLKMLKSENVCPDLVIFDPPYSARQVSECYQQIGKTVTMEDTQGASWSNWKIAIAEIMPPDSIVLSFGWNTLGMGKKHGFSIIEIMAVCHGGVHNDTLCMAEMRKAKQENLFM